MPIPVQLHWTENGSTSGHLKKLAATTHTAHLSLVLLIKKNSWFAGDVQECVQAQIVSLLHILFETLPHILVMNLSQSDGDKIHRGELGLHHDLDSFLMPKKRQIFCYAYSQAHPLAICVP
jgi:hypothetical protein